MGCRSDNTAHLLSGTYTNNTTDVIVTTHAHLSIIEILLEAGASCHIQFAINTAAPLYLAVQTGNVSVVESIVKFGARVNHQCQDGNTALHAAVKYGFLDIVECLLHHKADARLVNAKGEKASDVAVTQGNTHIVNLLAQLEKIEKNVFIKGFDGKEYASNMEDENCRGDTPRCLHGAARIGDINIVKDLVATGVNISRQCKYGYTPIRIAVREGHVDVAKFLIEKGANVDIHEKFSMSPLHTATWQKNPIILDLLLQNGANINSVDYFGRTPLHHTIIHESFQFAKILLEKGQM
ncbi:Ankyrin repeats (3 copies) [Popillia japonica]|uniref:Ankyrin repeats (3 copies) n=1 Tax=Popillia japonica TaxID=7064 RepID=A0AAW1HFY9_POPJA